MKDISRIATPLTKFTPKGIMFVWYEECKNSFQELKNRLTTTPILKTSINGSGFTILSDASKKGLGCVCNVE